MRTQKKIDYRDIVGYGNFDEHYGDRLHRLREVINQQNKSAIFYGELIGFQRLASLATRGRVIKAISEIEKKTRSFNHGRLDPSYSFYDGIGYDKLPSPKGNTGDCDCYITHIDACLFGARLAESAEKYSEALKLYQRAYRVLRTRGSNGDFDLWILTSGIRIPNRWSHEYQNREKMIRGGIKRVVKKSETGGKEKMINTRRKCNINFQLCS